MNRPPLPPFKPFMPPQRRELPARVKGVLGMKAMGSLAAIALSAILLFAFSDRSKWPDGMTPQIAHRFANYALLATAASLAELLGIAGTWNFKRWGVYILAAFTTLGFMFRISGGDKIGALISVASTTLVALVVASRWSDFD
jgi:ABC-type branched-subunit amino acid transport system permease subunit